MTRRLQHSATVPVPPADAFARTLVTPLPVLLPRRYLAVPAVVRMTEEGTWGSAGVGQQRVLHLGDGGTLRETLTHLDPPTSFRYRLDRITGPMQVLASEVLGTWAFEPAGTGTRITWTWDVVARRPVGPLLLPAFEVMWHGSARRVLDHLEDHLLA